MAGHDLMADGYFNYGDFPGSNHTTLVLQNDGIHAHLQRTNGGLSSIDAFNGFGSCAGDGMRSIGPISVRTINNGDTRQGLGLSSLSAAHVQPGGVGISGAAMFVTPSSAKGGQQQQQLQQQKQQQQPLLQQQHMARQEQAGQHAQSLAPAKEKARRGPRPGSKRKLSAMTAPEGDMPDEFDHGQLPSIDLGVLDAPAPEEPPARKKRAVIPKRERDMRARLSALEKDQLVNIICTLASKHGIHPADICGELPAVDLEAILERLRRSCEAIYKALPHTRFGSARDDFCYRRCATHVQAFKRAVSDEGKPLVEAGMTDEVIDYCVGAHDVVLMTPVWDSNAKNSSREVAFKALDRFLVNAIKAKGKKVPPEELTAILGKIRAKLANEEESETRFELAIAELNRRLSAST